MIRIIVEHNHYLHTKPDQDSELLKLVRQVLHINQNIMTIAEQLKEQVATLQTTIDETQDKFLVRMATLEAKVQELLDQIANGGNDPVLLEIGTAIVAATADLKSTFPEPPPEEFKNKKG